MKGNFLKIIFVIDESGSMQGSETDVIGGFNSLIERHKKETAGKVTVSLYKFNSLVSKVISNKAITKIKNLNSEDYSPNSFTALNDAIGQAIHETDTEVSSKPENERPDKVLIVIITDGHENASKEFSSQAIKTMIATHENLLNWDFIFLGVGLSDFADANLIGIQNQAAFRKSNMRKSFDKIADNNIAFCLSENHVDYDIATLVEDLNEVEDK